jgi:hypothetical protein
MSNQILYSYNAENNEIKPLPASPFLLPAILLYGFLRLCRRLFPTRGRTIRRDICMVGYSYYKSRYDRLLPKVLSGEELTLSEFDLWYRVLPNERRRLLGSDYD